MPRIEEVFLQCVVYLYKSPADAENGTKAGGTGFIVKYNLKKNNLKMYFVVTNAHVIDGISAPGAVRFNTKDGNVSIAQMYVSDWTRHPSGDDIAITSLNVSEDDKLNHSSIDIDMFASDEILKTNNIGPGNETFVIGRFVKHDDTKTNTPIARFGNISMMPSEPIVLESGHKQESFLIESRSLSGFSGSPVFVYSNFPSPTINGQKRDVLLLGLDCGHLNIYEPLRKKDGDKIVKIEGDNTVSISNSGQMIVVPAWKIREMLTVGPIAERINFLESS